jgi:hypothetical protein
MTLLRVHEPTLHANLSRVCAAFKIIVSLPTVFCVDSGVAQNIVEATSAADFTANPVRLTDMDVSEFIGWAGNSSSRFSFGFFSAVLAH